MLAYFCKYVPEELFQAFGTNITCMEPHVTTFTQADALMHPNMCSFSKAVLEEFEKQDYDGMIFTSCCDSSRRLYDILRHLFPDKFFFCLDPVSYTHLSVNTRKIASRMYAQMYPQ